MEDETQKILKDNEIIIHTYQNSLNQENISKLLKEINSITNKNKKSIIQLLNTENICGKKHLKQAIIQSIQAHFNKQNFAKDKGLEICIRASTQKQITKALNILGITENSNVTVVYINTTLDQINKTEKLLGKRDDQLLDQYNIEHIKKVYNITNIQLDQYNIQKIINEKIALLSLD
ncbi:MAG: KEOPS complex subunit Cgi121 [Methanobacteriaceae archaeon]|nr:KEOPS complex subunit Cgi121 [Methanobacteriaceae archaeon]